MNSSWSGWPSGPITGFGSIIVGGVRYDDSAALVTDDFDAPSDSARLRLGMVTEVRASTPELSASMPSATAMSVRFRSEIVGPVESVDAAAAAQLEAAVKEFSEIFWATKK